MSAVGLFEVGNVLNTRIRLFPESSTNNRVPSEATPPGRLRLCEVGGSGLSSEVKSACPTTTSAGAPLEVGMVFQIITRLFIKSATTSLVPLLQSPSGSSRLI